MNLSSIPTWCISLKKKGDKRFHHAIQVIRSLGLQKPKRFDAIDGNKLSDKVIKTLVTPRTYHELKKERYVHQAISGKGSIGCYLSHVNLWKKHLGNYVAIFEDDVNISPNAYVHLLNAWNYLKNNDTWNVFRIIYQYNPQTYIEGTSVHKNLVKDAYFQGLCGYFLSPRGAHQLLKEALPINEHVDYYINDRLEKLDDSGHYFLIPDINRDLNLESHIQHNRLCSYQSLNMEFIIWILLTVLFIISLYLN